MVACRIDKILYFGKMYLANGQDFLYNRPYRKRGQAMDRNEFISVLRISLSGEVSDRVVEDNVQYYYEYISSEIAGGKTEREVMEMLGDPRLIARTIIDTASGQGNAGSSGYYEETADSRQKGFHAEENQDGSVDIRYGRLKLNTWYGKLLVIALIVLVMALIFTIVGGILSFVLSILVPVVLVVFIIQLFTRRR